MEVILEEYLLSQIFSVFNFCHQSVLTNTLLLSFVCLFHYFNYEAQCLGFQSHCLLLRYLSGSYLYYNKTNLIRAQLLSFNFHSEYFQFQPYSNLKSYFLTFYVFTKFKKYLFHLSHFLPMAILFHNYFVIKSFPHRSFLTSYFLYFLLFLIFYISLWK